MTCIRRCAQWLAITMTILFPLSTTALGGNDSGSAYVGGSGGFSGGTCCSALPSTEVGKVAVTYGVNPHLANEELGHLGRMSFDDITILLGSPKPACEVEMVCDQFPEPLFRFLLHQALQRKLDAKADAVSWWADVRDAILAITAAAGLALSIVNFIFQVKDRRSKKSAENSPPKNLG